MIDLEAARARAGRVSEAFLSLAEALQEANAKVAQVAVDLLMLREALGLGRWWKEKVPMTFEESVKHMLIERGMFEYQADAVVELAKADESLKAMQDRWSHETALYPPQILIMLQMGVEKVALEYIDEHCPQAWFRPMFEKGRSADEN